MPNTLCHIALQGALHRTLYPTRGLLWVVIGCILPDIPWIILRTCLAFDLADPYTARLYTTIQASLFFCLLASAVLALFTVRPAWTFCVLSGNCCLHLLLDATQIKFAYGVHLIAPLNWATLHFNLFRMDHPLGLPLSLAGLFLLIVYWPQISREQHWPSAIKPSRALAAAACLLFYLIGPLPFLNQLEQSDFSYLNTLRDTAHRTGKYIEFDRATFDHRQQRIRIFSGEKFLLTGKIPTDSGLVSIRGRFVAPDIVQANYSQLHGRSRDLASMAGIFLACLLTLQTVILSRFRANISTEEKNHA